MIVLTVDRDSSHFQIPVGKTVVQMKFSDEAEDDGDDDYDEER